MSVRLTNALREEIQQKLINHKFTKPLGKLADRRQRFAHKIYNDVYSKAQRDLMEKCPKDWLNTSSSISIAFGGCSNVRHLAFNGDQYRYSCHSEIRVKAERRESIEKIVPEGSSYHRCLKRYEHGSKFYDEFHEIENAETDLHEQVHKAMAQSKAALWSVNTLKQLLELWPEIESFVPEYALRQDTSSTKKNLPAIPVDDLNASFGLKKAA